LTRPSQLALLRAHGIRPVKRRGQNFLLDANVARAIARETLALGARVLELGAGAGALTAPLLEGGARVTAVEVDRRLCDLLREEFGAEPRLRLLEADLARLDWEAALATLEPAAERLADGPAGAVGRGLPVVAGNLPYVLTSTVLFALADLRARVAGAVLMVQREVADRLAASPGGRDYGVLAALLGAAYTVEFVRAVPATVFWPRPEVASAVVKLVPAATAWDDDEYRRYRDTVKALFGQRRKKVGTLLRAIGGMTADEAAALAARAGLDPASRPEALEVAQLRGLAAALGERSAP
jgi:16S rRNA (adenine1518-N6/adenine1519-N6)-dimethyltransferase